MTPSFYFYVHKTPFRGPTVAQVSCSSSPCDEHPVGLSSRRCFWWRVEMDLGGSKSKPLGKNHENTIRKHALCRGFVNFSLFFFTKPRFDPPHFSIEDLLTGASYGEGASRPMAWWHGLRSPCLVSKVKKWLKRSHSYKEGLKKNRGKPNNCSCVVICVAESLIDDHMNASLHFRLQKDQSTQEFKAKKI